MVEDHYINSQETAFGAFNFKMTRPETFDDMPLTEEYQEPTSLILSQKENSLLLSKEGSKQASAVAKSNSSRLSRPRNDSKLSISSVNDSSKDFHF